LERIIKDSTRPNIEKLTDGFKIDKKIMADMKISQAMIESEILKIDIRIFILI
jgi:hypothetical protein